MLALERGKQLSKHFLNRLKLVFLSHSDLLRGRLLLTWLVSRIKLRGLPLSSVVGRLGRLQFDLQVFLHQIIVAEPLRLLFISWAFCSCFELILAVI